MFSIDDILCRIEKELAALPFQREPLGLYNPVTYMIAMGGKRLRPALCLLSCNLFTKEIDGHVLMPAMGLEVFHAFTLAHDDIMDAADIRRGHPTLHKKWNTNTAILSGDVMCIAAYTLISKCAPSRLPAVLPLFSHTAAQVCEGQQFDMDYEHRETITHEEYFKMIALKTAALIACASRMGAICGGAPESDARLLYDFGFSLGMGFQIRDDFLDAFGDPVTFGKSIGGDILNNKKTWLLVDAMQKAAGPDKKELHRLIHYCHDPEEKVLGIIDLYKKFEVPQAAEKKINDFHRQTIGLLQQIAVSENSKEQIYQYTTSLLNRKK